MDEGAPADALMAARIEDVEALLDGIDGAYEDAMLGLDRARAGESIPLGELSSRRFSGSA